MQGELGYGGIYHFVPMICTVPAIRLRSHDLMQIGGCFCPLSKSATVSNFPDTSGSTHSLLPVRNVSLLFRDVVPQDHFDGHDRNGVGLCHAGRLRCSGSPAHDAGAPRHRACSAGDGCTPFRSISTPTPPPRFVFNR